MRYSVFSALAAVLVWASLSLLALPSEGAAPASCAEAATEATAETACALPLPEVPSSYDAALRLAVQTENGVEVMDLHSYLTGVLLAEMPVSFEEEALKAQTVACRTYTLNRCRNPRHETAAVCTDAHCCQGWKDPSLVAPEDRERAEEAVRATDGLVLVYQDRLIDATFFSCSGGRTEDAAAVWGGDMPYLKSVESPGEEGAAHFSDELQLPLEEFEATLRTLDSEVQFSGAPESWISAVQYTAGGGVAWIELGGCSFRGTALRKAFGLRSTVFELELNDGEAVFHTKGNGHRVGMSQYGADAMARAGNDYETILKWYYQGVELVHAEQWGFEIAN